MRASGTAEDIFFGVPNLLLGGLLCLRGEVGKQSGSVFSMVMLPDCWVR